MRTGQDVIVVCKKCSSRVSMGDMNFDRGFGDFVCSRCYKGEKPMIKDRVILPNKERIKYRCGECGYAFSRSLDFQFNGYCYNCGKKCVEVEMRKVLMKTLDEY